MSSDRKEVTITVRVDRSLKSKMDERPEINWSAVARKAIRGTVEDLEVMDEIAARNQMTEADVVEVADAISERVNERTRAAQEEKSNSDRDRAGEEDLPEQSISGLAFETGRSSRNEEEDTSTDRDTNE